MPANHSSSSSSSKKSKSTHKPKSAQESSQTRPKFTKIPNAKTNDSKQKSVYMCNNSYSKTSTPKLYTASIVDGKRKYKIYKGPVIYGAQKGGGPFNVFRICRGDSCPVQPREMTNEQKLKKINKEITSLKDGESEMWRSRNLENQKEYLEKLEALENMREELLKTMSESTQAPTPQPVNRDLYMVNNAYRNRFTTT